LTVTFTNLVGARENLDKTIADLLSDNWTASNIDGNVTPYFSSDTDEPDQLARPDGSFVAEIRINYSSREKYIADDFEFNGDDKHAWVCNCFIEIQGESLQGLLDMEDEVHRILWENRPNNANRLNKSDGNASEVAFFENTEPEFIRLEPEGDDDQTPTSQAELKMVYFKIKS